ncbi:ABC transporter ATP-binding protein [Corynebacterium sphenisci]|uniref:ABC transporter ATP-binding protein n=1 Tax=Corynebacterium sphenisci TaxID=191493 RepID=UPI0026DEE72E|nr:ABC transporter ATP-binding protein [Corynebacterium sphenisci]MDO5730631.1 ABC transporter ATP-binding protein [Corynebacterium sphenisci]
MSGAPAVAARGFGWRHSGRADPVLREVDLTIEPGERVLVLGASGAGKSTLLAAIAGVLGGADEGEATGELRVFGAPADAARGEVGLVLQDPDSQVISARVADDVAFGAENLGVDRAEIGRRIGACLDLVGLRLPGGHPTSRLSGGQKQRLALAGVLAMGARIIALDEPTANIDPAGVPALRDAVLRAADATGATLIVVEHRVAAWVDVVDRVIVVGAGGIDADGPPARVLAEHGDRLRAAGVWAPGPPPDVGAARPAPADAEAALVAEDLAVGHRVEGLARPVRTGIDLAIPAGAATCVTGPNGVGKSTLALTLGGLLEPLAGRVLAAPGIAAGATPRRRRGAWTRRGRGTGPERRPGRWSSRSLAGRIGTVFQAPEHQFVTGTVAEELRISPRVLGLPERAAAARAEELLTRLRLDHLAAANPFTLSGGEKRRLSVATVLACAPRVVLLDEPTFGQDRRTFAELAALLRELAEEGVAVVSVTHNPLLVAALGDRVLDLGAVGRPAIGAAA